MKLKGKNLFFIVCILFFVFLIIQHQAVFLYHDDYGYAILSHGYEGNTHGMSWNIIDLVRFF